MGKKKQTMSNAGKKSGKENDEDGGKIDQKIALRTFKVILIGDSNVGKTCLTLRATAGKFPERTEATVGVDFKEKNIQVGEEMIKLQLWDSAGQERFRHSLVPHYYRNVHAVIFVYDVTRKSSFENIEKWLEEFRCNTTGTQYQVPQLIIGNKCDLHAEREVRNSEAKLLSSNYGIPCWETSAKSELEADTIEAIFQSLAETLKYKTPLQDFPPHFSTTIKEHHQKGLRVNQSLSGSVDLSANQAKHRKWKSRNSNKKKKEKSSSNEKSSNCCLLS